MNNGLIGTPSHVKRAIDELTQHMFRVPAAGPIKKGELVTMLENGKVAKTDTSLTMALENNTTNGLTAIRASASLVTPNYALTDHDESMCALSNGNIAMVYSGDGTTTATRVTLRIRNAMGQDGGAAATVTSDTSIGMMKVLALVDKVAVFWATGGNTIKFAIYNNDGTLATAAATITGAGNTAPHAIGIAALRSGDFVIAYDKSASRDCAFKRYNSSGALQGAETVIEAAAQPNDIAGLACANGDFVISYRNGAESTNKFARYNSSGVIQGTRTTFLGTASSMSGGCPQSQGIAELSNGNIVLQAAPSADTKPNLYVYSSANALVATCDLGTTITSSCVTPVVATTNGFAVGSMNSGTTYLWTFDNSGNPLLGQTSIDNSAQGDESYAKVQMFNIGVGFVFLRGGYNSGSSNYDIRLIETDVSGALKGSAVVVQAATPSAMRYASACMTASGVLQFQYSSNSTAIIYGAYKCLRSSIMGVADNGGTLNTQITIATKGSFALPASQAFVGGGPFDNRQAVVPGTRGVVAGTSVTLFGMDNYG